MSEYACRGKFAVFGMNLGKLDGFFAQKITHIENDLLDLLTCEANSISK